jgi:hypothetical protein
MSTTIRPVFTEYDLGRRGWGELFELARQRRRSPRDQIRQLVLFALHRSLAGEDVELGQEALSALLDEDVLEAVS